jgi:acetyl-CoA carboxylase carboxyl transferase subunit alpha
VKQQIMKDLHTLGHMETEKLIASRIDKFCAMGVVLED